MKPEDAKPNVWVKVLSGGGERLNGRAGKIMQVCPRDYMPVCVRFAGTEWFFPYHSWFHYDDLQPANNEADITSNSP